MEFRETLGERQPKTGSLVFSLQPVVDLAEGGERNLHVLLRHADAGVADGDCNLAVSTGDLQ